MFASKPPAASEPPLKVALAAPLPPIRSGVARHSAALARALARRPDVELRVWSFRRQYPPLLYPGAEERAKAVETGTEPGGEGWLAPREILTGTDPTSWLRAGREIARWRPDLFAAPAWTFFLAPCLAALAASARRAGAETCLIVHNVADHDGSALKRRISGLQLARADRFVTHNAAMADELAALPPRRPVAVHPHPVLDDLPEPTGALPRRAPLELLFFGLVRPYKGLDLALEAFARAGRADAVLTVAGEFWGGLDETRALIGRLGIGDRVELIPRYVADGEAAELFARADAVVLPYRSATGSGVIPTALRYGRATVCSDLPGLRAAVRPGETGWLVPPGDADALAAMLRGLDPAALARAGRAAGAFSAELGWEGFAATVLGETRSAPCAG